MKPKNSITAEDIRRGSRDPLILKVIAGATKAAVFKDRRKEASKRACRDWHRDV